MRVNFAWKGVGLELMIFIIADRLDVVILKVTFVPTSPVPPYPAS